jgi:hypothetical protein
MNRFGAVLLIFCGLAVALGHVVYQTWFSGAPLATVALYDRAKVGGPPGTLVHEIALRPDMNPVRVMLTGSVKADRAQKGTLIGQTFRVTTRLGDRPVTALDVMLAITSETADQRPIEPTGNIAAELPTPDEGRYQIVVEPLGRATGDIMTLGLDIRRNVAPISWAVIAGGLFLSLMGVLGLRSRRDVA